MSGNEPRQHSSENPPQDDLAVLQLIANGESYDEAAGILDVGRDVVDEAMRRVRRSLEALTDEHAVALAFRCRMID